MKEMTLDDFQRVSTDILKAVDAFCCENQINYSVGYGTLIGTIRHQGFIPWDDDIDLVMPRPDYEKFVSTFNEYSDIFKVAAPELDQSYYAPYANVYDTRTLLIEPRNRHGFEMGVKIDIFPIDGVTNEIDAYKRQCKQLNFINRIMAAKRRPLKQCIGESWKKGMVIMVVKIIFAMLSYRTIQKYIHKIALRYKFEESEYVDNVVYSPYFAKRHSQNCYHKFVRMPFEKEQVSVAFGYDEILSTIYGDYMKLPPENQRVTHHNFKAYWK